MEEFATHTQGTLGTKSLYPEWAGRKRDRNPRNHSVLSGLRCTNNSLTAKSGEQEGLKKREHVCSLLSRRARPQPVWARNQRPHEWTLCASSNPPLSWTGTPNRRGTPPIIITWDPTHRKNRNPSWWGKSPTFRFRSLRGNREKDLYFSAVN